MKKWMISIIVAVLIAGAGGFWFYLKKGDDQTASAASTSATVKQGKLEVKISSAGTVQSSTSVDLSGQVGSEVDEVLVDVDDEVEKGDVLVTFTDGSDPVVASAKGTVTSVGVKAGDTISSDTVVAHITNYDSLETVISVDEYDITEIEKGQEATVTINAFPDKEFTGTVSEVSEEGTSDGGAATFDVTIKLDDEDLRVGMTTEASIVSDSVSDALYLPVEAVQTDGDKKFVYVESGNSDDTDMDSMEKVTVKTGIANDEYIQITSGLEKGDKVQIPNIATGKTTNSNAATTSSSTSSLFGGTSSTGTGNSMKGSYSGTRGSYTGQ